MSILVPTTSAPPPARNIANTLREVTAQTYAHLCSTQRRGIALVWEGRDGATPQEVCDELGTDAVKIFITHGALTQLLVTLATIDGIAPNISLPEKMFTFNPDGTITILDEPYHP